MLWVERFPGRSEVCHAACNLSAAWEKEPSLDQLYEVRGIELIHLVLEVV